MQYFHIVHYHCNTLGRVSTTHETIEDTKYKQNTTSTFNKHKAKQPTTLKITNKTLKNKTLLHFSKFLQIKQFGFLTYFFKIDP